MSYQLSSEEIEALDDFIGRAGYILITRGNIQPGNDLDVSYNKACSVLRRYNESKMEEEGN